MLNDSAVFSGFCDDDGYYWPYIENLLASARLFIYVLDCVLYCGGSFPKILWHAIDVRLNPYVSLAIDLKFCLSYDYLYRKRGVASLLRSPSDPLFW